VRQSANQDLLSPVEAVDIKTAVSCAADEMLGQSFELGYEVVTSG
jgi:hypothetical protein